jgi:hypothetical protein
MIRQIDDKTVWFDANNNIHRADRPAIIHSDGSKQWWTGGKCHRIVGPAVE